MQSLTHELFERYRSQRWRQDLPLVVLHQHYTAGADPVGADTGLWQHMDFYALYVVRGGRGIHEINGHRYAVRRGDVYMTPPGATHRYLDYQDLRAEAFCFQATLFSDAALDALSGLAGFRHIFVRGDVTAADAQRDYQLHLSPAHYAHVEQLVDDLLAEMSQNEEVSPLLVRGLLFQLLVYLARTQPVGETVGKTGAPEAVIAPESPAMAEILRVCEAHFAEGLTVPQLAALMFLSVGHFSEMFAREVGMPPGAYLRRLRLERAQTLLRTTSLAITMVAQQSGFGDSAQLARAFKTAFGMTPRQYREQYSTAARR